MMLFDTDSLHSGRQSAAAESSVRILYRKGRTRMSPSLWFIQIFRELFKGDAVLCGNLVCITASVGLTVGDAVLAAPVTFSHYDTHCTSLCPCRCKLSGMCSDLMHMRVERCPCAEQTEVFQNILCNIE